VIGRPIALNTNFNARGFQVAPNKFFADLSSIRFAEVSVAQ
jgi:hypothetical protein